jgi:hypothetical protein
MQVMPVALGITECKLFYELSFLLKISLHFFNGDVVISYGRCLSISLKAKMLQFHDERRLVGLSSLRNSKWITKRKVVYFERYFHRVRGPPAPKAFGVKGT